MFTLRKALPAVQNSPFTLFSVLLCSPKAYPVRPSFSEPISGMDPLLQHCNSPDKPWKGDRSTPIQVPCLACSGAVVHGHLYLTGSTTVVYYQQLPGYMARCAAGVIGPYGLLFWGSIPMLGKHVASTPYTCASVARQW